MSVRHLNKTGATANDSTATPAPNTIALEEAASLKPDPINKGSQKEVPLPVLFSQSDKQQKTETVLSASELMDEFAQDRQKASEKYDGKTIEVLGIIAEVDRRSLGCRIDLKTNDALSFVTCLFSDTPSYGDGKRSRLAFNLQPGDKLKIRGRCGEPNEPDQFHVFLWDCTLVKPVK